MTEQRVILVVEDDPIILFAACEMLESAGFTVREAVSAELALQILNAEPGIGLLFTDIDMHGSMDGIALAHEVQKHWPHIGIVVTSGRWSPVEKLIPSGAAFIEKPYLEDSLFKALNAFSF